MCVPFSINIVQVDQTLGCHTTRSLQGRPFASNMFKDYVPPETVAVL
jgi:hypothetical protein